MFNPPQVDVWYKDGPYATIKYSDGTMLSVMNNSHNGFDSAKFKSTPEHTPIPVEERRNKSLSTQSARLEFIDFGKTEFHGIEFTHQDGSTQFVEPHPEVKEEVESLLDRTKTPTAVAQMESHNKQKAMKEGSKIYKGAVINSLRRFTGTDHLHADG